MPKANELKSGMVLTINDQPYIVRQVQAQNPSARGASTLYKVRFNHATSGQKLEQSLKGDDLLREADFQRRQVSYLFRDSEGCTFMDDEDYSQFVLNDEQLENLLPYLVDGLTGLMALVVDGHCVAVEPPQVVEMDIADTPPAIKGASQSARSKTATFSTGLELQVPEYIEPGQRVKINTATKEFMARA